MPPASPSPAPRWCVLGRSADGQLAAVDVTAEGERGEAVLIPPQGFAAFVVDREAASPHSTPIRWVWHDTAAIYPELLASGVRVQRCHDLRLSHLILSGSALVATPGPLVAAAEWSVTPDPLEEQREPDAPTLFDVEIRSRRRTVPASIEAALSELDRQREALAMSVSPQRLGLLLAAESAGALIAAELTAAGVPWDEAEHDRILAEALGPRPAPGAKPARMIAADEVVRQALGDASANIDSPPQLLKSLRAAGLDVASTSQWVIGDIDHPVIEPLLAYKRLARLLTANGWTWLDEWVESGRYRPVYIPGGVVTGRWSSSGGGALQIPRMLRPALCADPGWLLVSADVSQLEPRVLSAMAGDRAMATAGSGKDLYAGIVESGALETRQDAKIAMLGAMYGATTGDSGRLVPQLRRIFPAAMRHVDEAAKVGEQGGIVTTWLGRSSPAPSPEWIEAQSAASMPGATKRDEENARRTARERGRFTRNFVVQGTAAEWALAWMADLRQRLTAFPPITDPPTAHASGPAFERVPHLAFFLHDEVIVHTPREHADAVAAAITESAEAAGRLLFGDAPVDFRLDLRITERALKD